MGLQIASTLRHVSGTLHRQGQACESGGRLSDHPRKTGLETGSGQAAGGVEGALPSSSSVNTRWSVGSAAVNNKAHQRTRLAPSSILGRGRAADGKESQTRTVCNRQTPGEPAWNSNLCSPHGNRGSPMTVDVIFRKQLAQALQKWPGDAGGGSRGPERFCGKDGIKRLTKGEHK